MYIIRKARQENQWKNLPIQFRRMKKEKSDGCSIDMASRRGKGLKCFASLNACKNPKIKPTRSPRPSRFVAGLWRGKGQKPAICPNHRILSSVSQTIRSFEVLRRIIGFTGQLHAAHLERAGAMLGSLGADEGCHAFRAGRCADGTGSCHSAPCP